MWVGAWLFLGVLSLVWTLAILYIATRRNVEVGGVATIAGVTGAVLWLAWAWGALEFHVVSNGEESTYSHPELAAVGLMMAWFPGYVALYGPFELVNRFRRGDVDEV